MESSVPYFLVRKREIYIPKGALSVPGGFEPL